MIDIVKFNSINDFEKYWLDKNKEFAKKYLGIATEEEVVEITNETIKEVMSVFKDGDEIVHYNDPPVFQSNDDKIMVARLSREYVLVKRNGKVIKSILIRMS